VDDTEREEILDTASRAALHIGRETKKSCEKDFRPGPLTGKTSSTWKALAWNEAYKQSCGGRKKRSAGLASDGAGRVILH